MQNRGPRPPGNGTGHRTRPRDKAHRAARNHASLCKPDQTKPRTTTSPTCSVPRAQRLVDTAALLALDMAAIASESGRAHHTQAALHLRDATYYAWLAAEVLAEGVTL